MLYCNQRFTTLLLALIKSGFSCTYFEVRSERAPTVLGNTMEWIAPESADSWQVEVVQRNENFKPSCQGGSGWQGRLGLVGMTSPYAATSNLEYRAGQVKYRSGFNSMNEAGLAISVHALRGVSSYMPAKTTTTVCMGDFATWVVTTFHTVHELRKVLPSVALLTDDPGTTSKPGLQWAIADAEGDSVVVDYVAGSLRVHNNSAVGVLTNDPTYPWQVQNLNNYVGLSMAWPSENDGIAVNSEFGTAPIAVGHGQNMLGLPGDLSPPSRFVRTFFTRSYAVKAAPPQNLEDALVIASGVLNTQYIVKGFNARLQTEHYDYTQFGVMKVPSEKLFYYRTYEASQWRLVNLSAVDFDRSAYTKPAGGFAAVDVTKDLQPASLIGI